MNSGKQQCMTPIAFCQPPCMDDQPLSECNCNPKGSLAKQLEVGVVVAFPCEGPCDSTKKTIRIRPDLMIPFKIVAEVVFFTKSNVFFPLLGHVCK